MKRNITWIRNFGNEIITSHPLDSAKKNMVYIKGRYGILFRTIENAYSDIINGLQHIRPESLRNLEIEITLPSKYVLKGTFKQLVSLMDAFRNQKIN